jgi:hypothetical protein
MHYLHQNVAECMKKFDWKMLDHMKCVFNIAYYMAKHNKPYTDIGGLVALEDKLGVRVRSEYSNDMRCAEFVSHIAEVLRKYLICGLQKQKYISLLLDASTDRA